MPIPRDAASLVESVYEFNRLGGPIPPGHFNAERVGFYTGMQLEELGEKLSAIAYGHVETAKRHDLLKLALLLKQWGISFKSGEHQHAVLRADREKLLDGDIDVVVVALGATVYQTPQFREAIGEVLGKNADKEWADGTFHHDANGKIMKPADWTAPNLAPFVDNTGL